MATTIWCSFRKEISALFCRGYSSRAFITSGYLSKVDMGRELSSRHLHDLRIKTQSDSYTMRSLMIDDFGQQRAVPYVDEGSEGTPIVILGGTAQTINTFTTHIKPMSKSNRVIVMELRGQGSNQLQSSYARMHQHVVDVHEVLRKLQVSKIYLCGFSFGGRVAIAFAAHHSEMVEKLSVTGISMSRPKLGEMIIKSWEDALRRGNMRECAWSFILNGYSSSFIEKYYSKLESFIEMVVAANDPNKLYDLIRLSHNTDGPDAEYTTSVCAPRVRCPTQIIAATDDRIAGYQSCLDLAKHIRTCPSIISLEAGHLAPFEHPMQWRRAVLDFFLKNN